MSNEDGSPCQKGVTKSSSHSWRSFFRHPATDERIKKLLDPAWLWAHNRTINSVKITSHPQELIFIFDSLRPHNEIEDLGSIYRANEVDDIEKLNDLFTFFNEDEAGPFKVGWGQGKEFPGIMDYLNDPEPEDKEDMKIDEAFSKAENSEYLEGKL